MGWPFSYPLGLFELFDGQNLSTPRDIVSYGCVVDCCGTLSEEFHLLMGSFVLGGDVGIRPIKKEVDWLRRDFRGDFKIVF